ncbi:hypothetical protein AMAG_06393 [Allomyces macrogynus ATCC 38327]|uniref:Bestrophin, RFP-TM, chloride channel n=2 Tax=Allomyces macrogynus (strain ATCC 38327) TaxID=578462 RepID=A0A0L0SGU1_ALLM3|nr:hypothetical protein AMAG_06393 [Allomyces macrogynus ATCC 38327]|eukprot:KNE61580.1 hypothetical protein AMAG_06393 [Allomyces macrogynus ATCC 38327]
MTNGLYQHLQSGTRLAPPSPSPQPRPSTSSSTHRAIPTSPLASSAVMSMPSSRRNSSTPVPLADMRHNSSIMGSGSNLMSPTSVAAPSTLLNKHSTSTAAAPKPRRAGVNIEPKINLKENIFGRPDAFHWHGSVIPRIALPVIIFTLWNLIVWVIDKYAMPKSTLALPATFITIISLVLSLLLVFRTNSSYERYNEGRKLWGTLIVSCRNLSRIIWVGIAANSITVLPEKRAALKLVLAFFMAVRNHVRAEYGLKDEHGNWREDLVRLIPVKKREQLQQREEDRIGGPLSPLAEASLETELTPAPAAAATTTSHQLGLSGSDALHHRRPTAEEEAVLADQQLPYGAAAPGYSTETGNLPVDISHLLSAYIIKQRKLDRIDVPQFGSMVGTISTMIDCLTNIERIATSPVPLAYRVHLKQILYVYLLLLPFQIIASFGAMSILVTFLASFTLLGVESIGAEIEFPFGLDLNDLPLDRFVRDMTEEISAIINTEPVSLADWELTKPFHPNPAALMRASFGTLPARARQLGDRNGSVSGSSSHSAPGTARLAMVS